MKKMLAKQHNRCHHQSSVEEFYYSSTTIHSTPTTTTSSVKARFTLTTTASKRPCTSRVVSSFVNTVLILMAGLVVVAVGCANTHLLNTSPTHQGGYVGGLLFSFIQPASAAAATGDPIDFATIGDSTNSPLASTTHYPQRRNELLLRHEQQPPKRCQGPPVATLSER